MNFDTVPAWRLIGITSNMLRRAMDKKFSDSPYSPTELACISYIAETLRENPEIHVFQKDIEKEFNLRSSTASETLKNLENKGLIRREGIEDDGRKKKLIPTETALKYNSKNEAKLQELEQSFTKDIPPEQLEIYRKVIIKIINNLRLEDING
mgnify:CR=1 FL=1